MQPKSTKVPVAVKEALIHWEPDGSFDYIKPEPKQHPVPDDLAGGIKGLKNCSADKSLYSKRVHLSAPFPYY